MLICTCLFHEHLQRSFFTDVEASVTTSMSTQPDINAKDLRRAFLSMFGDFNEPVFYPLFPCEQLYGFPAPARNTNNTSHIFLAKITPSICS